MSTAYHVQRRMFKEADPVLPRGLRRESRTTRSRRGVQVRVWRGSSKENTAGLPAEPTPPK